MRRPAFETLAPPSLFPQGPFWPGFSATKTGANFAHVPKIFLADGQICQDRFRPQNLLKFAQICFSKFSKF